MASSTVYSFAAGLVVVVVVVVVRRIPLDTSEVKPSSRTPLPSTPLCGPGEVPSHSARRDPEDTKSTDSNSSLKSNPPPPPPPGDDDDDRTPTPPRDLFPCESSETWCSSSSLRSRDPNGFPVVVVVSEDISKTFFESGGGKRLSFKRGDFMWFGVLKRRMHKGLYRV